MQAYLNIVKKNLEQGEYKNDRTGTGTLAMAGAMFEHNMDEGFPTYSPLKSPV